MSQPDTSKKASTAADPYCGNCGYSFVGLIDSSKCPECGRPIVEVLLRDSFPGQKGERYESSTRLFGLPLIAVATGPYGDEKIGRAKGIIAIGDAPRGIVAIGGAPIGVFAFGGVARGVFVFGGVGLGLVSFSGLSLGIVATGGVACGLYALGGVAIGVMQAWGGLPIPLKLW